MSRPALMHAAVEIERHVAAGGWDQPTRLYALVDTAALLADEPSLAGSVAPAAPGASFTPVEQEDLPDVELDELLAAIAWPDEVDGAAVVVERLVLPPEAEASLAGTDGLEGDDLAARVAQHPDREEVRMVVAVLRTGERECVLRLRSRDDDLEVLSGPDLVPGLADAVARTFEP